MPYISISGSHKKTIRKSDCTVILSADYTVISKTRGYRKNRTFGTKDEKDDKDGMSDLVRYSLMYLDNSIADENAAKVRFSRMCPIKHPKSAMSEIPGTSREIRQDRQIQTWERCKMDIWNISPETHEGPKARQEAIRAIPAKMVELAEIDLNLPFSLMADAWDACLMSGQSYVDQTTWAYTLVWAIRAYEADPLNYAHKHQMPLS